MQTADYPLPFFSFKFFSINLAFKSELISTKKSLKKHFQSKYWSFLVQPYTKTNNSIQFFMRGRLRGKMTGKKKALVITRA